MKASALVPATGARWLRNEVDRLLDRAWEGEDFTSIGEWAPRVDLSETPEAVVARAEIPGIDPKDIQITLDHDVLTIRGEKREESERKSETMLRIERSYGSFARSMKLPSTVNPNMVEATFHNGLLTITLPKAPEARGTTIPIKIT